MVMKKTIYVFVIALFTLFLSQGVMAQDLIPIELDQKSTSMVPLFMQGHENDPAWIEGFQFGSDLLLEGTKIGTYSGQVMLSEPPMDLTSVYDDTTIEGELDFPGIGTCQMRGFSVSLGSSTSASTGELALSSVGRVFDCTDSLSGLYGLVTTHGTANVFTGQSEQKMTLNVRFGF